MKFSFHHLTLEPEKIIRNIINKEKKAVEDYGLALEFEKTIIEAGYRKDVLPNSSFVPMSKLGNTPEQVVVKKWNNIISIYPMTVTQYQENNVPWPVNKCDSYINSITQKYGSIMVYWDAVSLKLGFLLKGNVISEKEMLIDASLIDSGEYTLQKCAPKEMLQAILHSEAANQSECLNLDIPLMLPSDWKDSWVVGKQTQLVTICE